MKPSLILYEPLGRCWYDPKLDEIVLVGEITPIVERHLKGLQEAPFFQALISVAKELGIPILGCDMSRQEVKDLGIKLGLIATYWFDVIDLGGGEEYDIARVALSKPGTQVREEEMVRRMREEVLKSADPTVAILGAEHSERMHRLKMLQNLGIGYAVIDQRKQKKT